MKTITTKVYNVDELTPEAKAIAIEDHRDINVEHWEWWHGITDDLEQIECELGDFDLGRANYCNVRVKNADRTKELILKGHGDKTPTYELAKQYDGKDPAQFQEDLSNEYLKLLNEEYEYHICDDSVFDTLRANEYEFTEDGKLFNF